MPTKYFKNTNFKSAGFEYEIEVVAKFLKYSKKLLKFLLIMKEGLIKKVKK